VLLGLTGGQKLGLALAAGIFIAFALASSFLLPRWRPDYPGTRGLKLFIAVTIVLLVSMLTAVAVLARESEEEGGEHEAVTAPETQTGETRPPTGDPQAGKDVFATAGCGGCHTLADAGSTGQVGPNLDESRPDLELALARVTEGRGVMPSFKAELSEKQIQDVAAYVVDATGGS
jgi:cytochrome c6